MTIRRKNLLETIERWVSLIALKIQNQEKFDNIFVGMVGFHTEKIVLTSWKYLLQQKWNAYKILKKFFVLLENEIKKTCVFHFFSIFFVNLLLQSIFLFIFFFIFSAWPRTAISREVPYLRWRATSLLI